MIHIMLTISIVDLRGALINDGKEGLSSSKIQRSLISQGQYHMLTYPRMYLNNLRE